MDKRTFLAATMTQLSELTQIPRNTWKHYFYKGETPGIRFMRKAAEGLGMSLEEFDEAMSTKRQIVSEERAAKSEIERMIRMAK